MGPEIGEYIGRQIFWLVICMFIAGAVLATVLIFGIPVLWDFVKPFLHEATR